MTDTEIPRLEPYSRPIGPRLGAWQPISTAPSSVNILTYAEWETARPVGISRYEWQNKTVEEVEHESSNASGRRRIIQERTIRQREWSGDHYEPTHWQPLPEPPKELPE